jgi:hypothetical protein
MKLAFLWVCLVTASTICSQEQLDVELDLNTKAKSILNSSELDKAKLLIKVVNKGSAKLTLSVKEFGLPKGLSLTAITSEGTEQINGWLTGGYAGDDAEEITIEAGAHRVFEAALADFNLKAPSLFVLKVELNYKLNSGPITIFPKPISIEILGKENERKQFSQLERLIVGQAENSLMCKYLEQRLDWLTLSKQPGVTPEKQAK